MNDLAIFIISCDKYSDIWNPFFEMFFKYWDDCPYTIYLCTDSLIYDHPKIITLAPGIGRNWSEILKYGLERCPHQYVLLLQEDYIVYKRVYNNVINHYLNIAQQAQAACVKLVPHPAPDAVYPNNKDVGFISKGREYRVSTQAAIWNKEALLSLIDVRENPWEFEHKASIRSNQTNYLFLSINKLSDLFSVTYPYHYYITSVVGGKWKRIAVRICKKNRVKVDLDKRPMEGFWNMIYYDYAPGTVKHVMDFVGHRFLKKKYWGYN